MDEAEKKKAQILSRTQMILERTKARLAQEKEGKAKRLGGKRQTKGEGKLNPDKVKSRSIIKDDPEESDDDNEANTELDLSFNTDLMQQQGRDIIKDMKKKIDEKLGNYDFSNRPLPEKKSRLKLAKDKSMVKKDRRDRDMNSKGKSRGDKMAKMKDKREKVKAMMRRDYENNFSESQPKVKKPVIIKRHQQQPPPMNFADLLKIAEKKSQEKAPDPVKVMPKKKVEERPQTQEELDRRRREKESRQRKKDEEMGIKTSSSSHGSKDSREKNDSGSSILKGALTKGGAKDKSVINSSQAKGGRNDPKGNQPAANGKNDNRQVGMKREPETAATNPWDRIYGQIQKNNPKAEKRKRQVIESDEEQDYDDYEDEYDEDDDFIDDGDAGEDYSAHIRNIFGYDKRKFRDEDDDIDNMEANFTTIMKEEAISTKIGKMEDLEDIRREEEELKRKKLAKMKKMKYR